MRRLVLYPLLFFALCTPLCAQFAGEGVRRGMNEGTLAGFGNSVIKDTYLSPFTYTGWSARILNERMTLLRNMRFSRQQIISVDISSTKNPAENVSDFGAFVDYSLAYHYRFRPGADLVVVPGAFAHLMGGFVYNTRNGNNPLSAKVDADAGLSIILFYTFRISRYSLILRYQGEAPLAGIFFAPPYKSSYYEIFNEGNTSNIIALNSFHNKLSVRNYLTLDIPIHGSTLRVGYLGSLYYSDIKFLETRIFSNALMLGWVKNFVLQ
ncbi:MAG: DUF3316 domain-containing protein [Tannerellaceae bacterium]|jgi:hypothetical protein|nr:DUF3316 domain-containing protein [Tannerellaceae bacterium]